ncbi:hypothetical protein [uncultured Umboniibacter sp.]|uniref:hypothetical protein n=1 Tax=uncultured Umboniibacter sp. TaxID=1798917 RepID=UPI00261956BC|nr:hypothetical protein [uncultured Umboniibacter sp.]
MAVRLLAIFLLCFSMAAEANWRSAIPRITPEDMALLSTAVSEGLNNQPVGTEVAWQNDESGSYGTAKLLRLFTLGDVPCRRIRYTVTTSNKDNWQLDFDFCLNQDGLWERQPGLFNIPEVPQDD